MRKMRMRMRKTKKKKLMVQRRPPGDMEYIQRRVLAVLAAPSLLHIATNPLQCNWRRDLTGFGKPHVRPQLFEAGKAHF